MNVLVGEQLINYVDKGEGRVIILLHGWGATLSTFAGLSDNLTKDFRVISIDFPGFGASPKPDDSWGVGEYANLVAELIVKLKLGDVYAVIGHSFGGRVIIKGIASQLFTSQKIVLIDAAGVKPSNDMKKNVFKTIAKIGNVTTMLPGIRALRPALRKKLYGAAGASDYLNSAAMQKIFLNTINEDLLPLVHSMKQPTLLIWGEADQDTPVGDAYKMMNELPDGQLVVIPNAGHFSYADNLSSVMKEIKAFLV